MTRSIGGSFKIENSIRTRKISTEYYFMGADTLMKVAGEFKDADKELQMI
jgi:hypothetical protein